MKITCSAAFNTTCIILHLCSVILLKCLGFKKTHPGSLMHQESRKKLHTQGELEQRDQLLVRQCRASLCRTHRRHCSLCERGNRVRLAFLSPSQLRSTNITLVLAFFTARAVSMVQKVYWLFTIITRQVSQSAHSSHNTATRSDGRAKYSIKS